MFDIDSVRLSKYILPLSFYFVKGDSKFRRWAAYSLSLLCDALLTVIIYKGVCLYRKYLFPLSNGITYAIGIHVYVFNALQITSLNKIKKVYNKGKIAVVADTDTAGEGINCTVKACNQEAVVV
jgi:hypothetical protein